MKMKLLGLLIGFAACGTKAPEAIQPQSGSLTMLWDVPSTCDTLHDWDGVEAYGMMGEKSEMILFIQSKVSSLNLKTNVITEIEDRVLTIGTSCTVTVKNGNIMEVTYDSSATSTDSQ